MHNGASSYVPCCPVSTEESLLRTISLAAEWFALSAKPERTPDCNSSCKWWQHGQALHLGIEGHSHVLSVWIDPIFDATHSLALEACRVGLGRESWSLWTFWTVHVRWFILAHSPHWTPPQQTWGSHSVWCCQGIHWALWACLVCVGKGHCDAVNTLCSFSKVSFWVSYDASRFRVNRTLIQRLFSEAQDS
jgi:hypothetical protein